MSLRKTLLALACAAAVLGLAPAAAQTPHNLILFVPDGLRAQAVTPQSAPTMAAVRDQGVNFANPHSLFPTFTMPNSSGLATGHFLGDTGAFSNAIFTGYPVAAADGSMTPFIESDPILGDIDAHFSGNFVDEDTILLSARHQGFSTAAIGKLGPLDLVLCGEGSADLYFQQVGLQVGERLELPTLNAVSRVAPLGEDRVLVERSLEDEVETLEAPLPAALSIAAEAYQPRLPTMKQILLAGKKPVTSWNLADLGFAGPPERRLEPLSTQAPPRAQRKQVAIGGTAEEAAQALVNALAKDGII
jgi:hypothetical protein